MKVIAAVPNYNMRQNLTRLLARVLEEEFDAVYLLDDASTDGSVEYTRGHFPSVRVLSGRKNLGAGANRNRIIPQIEGSEVVLFLDADLQLKTTGLVEKVRGWFKDDKVGLVGGQILAKNGHPMYWNYGPDMSPQHDFRVEVYNTLKESTRIDSKVFRAIRDMALAKGDTFNFEIQYGKREARNVDWVAEGLFAVRGDLFRKLGGFDERFRYHADQDLSLRVRKSQYIVRFDPGIAARHLELNVRGVTRWDEFRDGQFLYYQKHWGMNRQVFDRLFPQEKEEDKLS